MTYSILQSLAYLKIHSDDKKGLIFLDNFIPFVIEALKHHQAKKISLPLLQELLRKQFGLNIPQNVIKAILFRAKKNGYVILNHSELYKNEARIAEFPFSTLQSKVERIYSALLASLIEFAKNKYDVTISEEEAENLFLSFISYNQFAFYQTHDIEEFPINRVKPSAKDKKFIIASYILNAKKQDPQIFEYIDVIVKGFMISQVLYLPDAHETKKRFMKTKVFLDTSFIIYALGYSGPEFKSSSIELLQLLYKNNATICCFQHTVEEIEGILIACSRRLGNYSDTPFGRTVRYFESIGDTPSDIRLKISRLKKNLQNLNIMVENIPDYSDHRYVTGEAELFALFKSKMPKQRDDEAVNRDVASISAIYRYRRNNYSSFIENSAAIFVTTSTTLAKASNEYFYKHNDRSIAPPCVTDYFLTNILWLKTPNQAPDLPMKRIIADAYAAIQPSDALMEKWLREIERLKQGEPVTEEDYYFMRSSEEIHISLMEKTLGDTRAITSERVKTIIENARDNLRKQAEAKLYPQLVDGQKSVLEYQRILKEEEQRKLQAEERRKTNARRLSKLLIKFIELPLLLFVILLVLVSLPYDLVFDVNPIRPYFSDLPIYFSRIALLGLFIVSLVLGVASTFYGYSVNWSLRSLETRFENAIYKALKGIAEKI